MIGIDVSRVGGSICSEIIEILVIYYCIYWFINYGKGFVNVGGVIKGKGGFWIVMYNKGLIVVSFIICYCFWFNVESIYIEGV